MSYYNLDMIISLGYRVKSRIATQFRRWATERLKEYIIMDAELIYERPDVHERLCGTLEQSAETYR